MHQSNKFKIQINKKGYVILRNVLNEKTKKKLLKLANEFSKKLISKWPNSKKDNKNLYKDIIEIYKLNNCPEYRRNPNTNLVTKTFFDLVYEEVFSKLNKKLGEKEWYFSYYKNLRFKSSVLPWTKEMWHCDRYSYKKDFFKKNFKFKIVWVPLQNMKNNCDGGLEIVKKNNYFNSLYFYKQKKKNPASLFDCSKEIKKRKDLKFVRPKLNFGDILIMDSLTFHRTLSIKSKKPFWSLDLRFEHGKDISFETKKKGFNFKDPKSYNFKKFYNSIKS